MKVKGCLKLASTFYSFLTLSGCTTVGLSIWSLMKKSKTSGLFKIVDGSTLATMMSVGGPTLIALGCVLTLMGVFGCLGTLKKKRWMLLVFFIIVLIIFILQVIMAVFILLPNSVKEKSLSGLESKLVTSLQKNYKEDATITSIWDETMTKVRQSCMSAVSSNITMFIFTNFSCNAVDTKAMMTSTYVMKQSLYPKQCCGQDSTCGKDKAENKKVQGCIHVLWDENVPISGALSFLIGILEIVALVVSLKVYQCLGHVPSLPEDNL